MTPRVRRYLEAGRVPASVEPCSFGLWRIERMEFDTVEDLNRIGWLSQTVLSRFNDATIHLARGEIVMEDSRPELSRHIPAWLAARGHVLVTGLGLGCVIRGLLANPAVEGIDVVEIDQQIIDRIEHTVADPRVTLHHGDAHSFTAPRGRTYDLAWHDIHQMRASDAFLAMQHAELMARFNPVARRQGCWGWPREIRRKFARSGFRMVGI